jgi:primary-amine oxidase
LIEYIWNYYFYQDASIEFEIRLTGALQTYVANNGEPSPHGTLVAPNINAHYHQHMFSIRVDPMIDGLNNTLIESDIMPLPDAPTKSAANFAGNAFISVDKVIEKEAGRAYDYAKERRWRIVNSAEKHYSSGRDVGYTLGVKGGATPMIVRDDSWAAVRAAFLKNTVWVCRDVEGEDGKWGSERMWPSGKYVPQTREEPKDSIGEWVKGELPVVDEDILVYLTVGQYFSPLQPVVILSCSLLKAPLTYPNPRTGLCMYFPSLSLPSELY